MIHKLYHRCMVRFFSHQSTPCEPRGDEARWCRKSQARGSQIPWTPNIPWNILKVSLEIWGIIRKNRGFWKGTAFEKEIPTIFRGWKICRVQKFPKIPMICQALRVENFLNDQCEFRKNFSVHSATFQSHEAFWMAIFWCHLWTAIQLFSKVFAKTCPWFSWNLVKYLCSFNVKLWNPIGSLCEFYRQKKHPILLLSPRLHVCTILIQHDKFLNSDFDIVHRKDKDDFGWMF